MHKLPKEPGFYEVLNADSLVNQMDPEIVDGIIQVYHHPIKGLCVFYPNDDNEYSDTACHVSIQISSLEFGKKINAIQS